MSHSDYQMALLLQKQFEHEANMDTPTQNLVYKKCKPQPDKTRSESLTDPSWELIDPTPNIHVLFMAFNEKYFWNKLLAVCVDWSKRMTSCAGVCSYQGRGGMCRITLSEPLLKLRPRKDLVETLLHEMIHAYLFVTENNRDRDGHGSEFHKHMYRINAEAGTNITVYHDFHDEVRLYQQHWWRCDGPCQTRKPFFGMVRRATNRAPGPNDFWWAQHLSSCGGTFVKVKEPENYKKKQRKESKPTPVSPKSDIRNFYPVIKTSSNSPSSSSALTSSLSSTSTNSSTSRVTGFTDLNKKPGNMLANRNSTIVVTKNSTKTKADDAQPEKPKQEQPAIAPFTGTGQVLGGKNRNDSADYATVRNHWLNKFESPKRASDSKPLRNTKKAKTKEPSSSSNDATCPSCSQKVPLREMNTHLDQCLERETKPSGSSEKCAKCPVCAQDVYGDGMERHLEKCVNEVFSEHNDFEECTSPKEYVSCLVCSKQVVKDELSQHLDECMGDNIFKSVGDGSGVAIDLTEETVEKNDGTDKKYNCPVCFQQFAMSEMSGHLDTCLVTDNEGSKGDGVLNSFLEDDF